MAAPIPQEHPVHALQLFQQHLVHTLQLSQENLFHVLFRRLHDGHATTYAAWGPSPASRNRSCLTTQLEVGLGMQPRLGYGYSQS